MSKVPNCIDVMAAAFGLGVNGWGGCRIAEIFNVPGGDLKAGAGRLHEADREITVVVFSRRRCWCRERKGVKGAFCQPISRPHNSGRHGFF